MKVHQAKCRCGGSNCSCCGSERDYGAGVLGAGRASARSNHASAIAELPKDFGHHFGDIRVHSNSQTPPAGLMLLKRDTVYKPTEMSDAYWRLSAKERSEVNAEVDRIFRERTGITRRLDWDNDSDEPLGREWLRIRDEVMAKRLHPEVPEPPTIETPLEKAADPETLPQVESPKTDCTTAQTTAIDDGVRDASMWLDRSIDALTESPIKEATIALLKKHFKTADQADIDKIAATLKKIKAEIGSSSLKYECEDGGLWCAMGSAYTHCNSDTVHICSDVFDLWPGLMTRTVIHENAHHLGICGTEYYCDMHEEKYKAMSKDKAIANADTYAAFCGELSGGFDCF